MLKQFVQALRQAGFDLCTIDDIAHCFFGWRLDTPKKRTLCQQFIDGANNGSFVPQSDLGFMVIMRATNWAYQRKALEHLNETFQAIV